MGKELYDIIGERIVILDGGMGTMIQRYGLREEEYRGEEFASWHLPLKGCNDLLALTRPEVIGEIHRAYLEAGADIITTDSFNANRISLADYGLQEHAYAISRAAAQVARRTADDYMREHPQVGPRFVSGSVGPTSKSSSIATDMNDTARREVDFEGLVAAYTPQIEGLVDGGADIIQFETFFDTLNCKAAIFAAGEVFASRGRKLPLIVSGTLTNSGRTLSGQTVEAFYASVAHARPLAVGFNCSFGARQLLPYLKRMADIAECPVSVYPNAGLPNLAGEYEESPETMAVQMEEYFRQGLVNIAGGCCGTTPDHIRAVAEAARRYPPRPLPVPRHRTMLAGLEPLVVDEMTGFVSVGERTNVAGSAKFARLIREGRFEEALAVARNQIEGGAQVIDICFDDGMIDGPAAMRRFLNMAAAEPEIARVPVMIDSSSWEVLEAGLQCVQGKSIVNSISLKEGEETFLHRASLIRRYGAAAVVMLFDERGQADVYERKIEVAARAYRLLTAAGFPPEDIVFDPNVLAVATGIPEHDVYARDFIRATEWIRANLPGVNVSGGISNLSFAFRGVDRVRRAMHSVFLYHGRKAGLNFGIVNPAMTDLYEEIEPELLALAEDVVLARRTEAAENLAAYAERVRGEKEAGGRAAAGEEWRSLPVGERIYHAMVKGIADRIADDALEAVGEGMTPLEVIDRCFMPAMEHVGELFGQGKMFLPQVVKTARVMKKGVGALTPLIEGGSTENSGKEKALLATVKGDVHDIGKNIVSVVMACNGYRIRDLGVMVECEDIVDTALEWGADVIGLSALITPSLGEMIKVVRELERRGVRIPVVVGGATTSGVHTAVKIAPEYSGPVIHCRDASENVVVLGKLFGPEREEFLADLRRRQEELRRSYAASHGEGNLLPLTLARTNRHVKRAEDVELPRSSGIRQLLDYPICDVIPYIDWSYFISSWGLKGRWPEILFSSDKGEEARKLVDDAQTLLYRIGREKLLTLNAVVGIFPAFSRGDDIVVEREGRKVVLPQLRCQSASAAENLSLADYVLPEGEGDDYVCLFAASAGFGLHELVTGLRESGDEYGAILAKLLADRLAEAFAEALHVAVRRDLWGFEAGETMPVQEVLAGNYQGARMAFGYPAVPDHSLKKEVFRLLDAERITGMKLTDSYMIDPGESLCGMILADRHLKYFDVGKIDAEQLADYARRRRITPEEAKRLLPKNIV